MVLRQALAATSEPERRAKLQEAEAFARKAIEVDPALPDAFTTLGVVLSTSGRKADAIDSWKRAVELDRVAVQRALQPVVRARAAGRRDEASTYGRQFVDTAPPAFFAPDIARVRAYLVRGLTPFGRRPCELGSDPDLSGLLRQRSISGGGIERVFLRLVLQNSRS